MTKNTIDQIDHVSHNEAMTKPLAVKTNIFEGALHTRALITADDSGELPTRIMLVKAGSWGNSVKGKLVITIPDLHEMKANFDKGVGRGGNKEVGLPIDFEHQEWSKAAAWINEMEVEGDTLYSVNTEWTTDGKAAVLGGMYKCISPSFYPSDRGGYVDPEDFDSEAIPNTVVGAGLTNIPFFKSLSAVKADSLPDTDDDDNMIFINKSESTKEEIPAMTLADVRVKAAADLTADEEKLLADNRDQLTDAEKEKFNLKEAAQVTAAVTQGTISDADAKILADIKAGNVKIVSNEDSVISASELSGLRDTAEQYRTEKAQAVVDAHVARGAVKADQRDRWTARLLKADKTDRVELEADLSALPANPILAAELGSDEAGVTGATAREQLSNIAAAKVAAAAEKGQELNYTDALRMAASENADLTKQDLIDVKGN